jgi:hypothetical protein
MRNHEHITKLLAAVELVAQHEFTRPLLIGPKDAQEFLESGATVLALVCLLM